MATQEIFNRAIGNYQSARALVAKMNEIIASARPEYNPKVGRFQLDIIVQYTLLEVALADGKFSPIEGEFIDKITDSFDVIRLLDNIPDGRNWQWFATNKSFSEIKDVIGQLRNMAQEHMQAFAQLFAIVDALYPDYNILKELLGYLGAIAGCFIIIDGNDDERESEIAKQVTLKYLIEPWVNMMDNIRK